MPSWLHARGRGVRSRRSARSASQRIFRLASLPLIDPFGSAEGFSFPDARPRGHIKGFATGMPGRHAIGLKSCRKSESNQSGIDLTPRARLRPIEIIERGIGSNRAIERGDSRSAPVRRGGFRTRAFSL